MYAQFEVFFNSLLHFLDYLILAPAIFFWIMSYKW